MLDRQHVGDAILAILIAVPIAALAQPNSMFHGHRTGDPASAQRSAVVLASGAERQVGLFR